MANNAEDSSLNTTDYASRSAALDRQVDVFYRRELTNRAAEIDRRRSGRESATAVTEKLEEFKKALDESKAQREKMAVENVGFEEVDMDEAVGKHNENDEEAGESDGGVRLGEPGTREHTTDSINAETQQGAATLDSAVKSHNPEQDKISDKVVAATSSSRLEAATRAFDQLYPGAYDMIKAGNVVYRSPSRNQPAAAANPRDLVQGMSDRFAATVSATNLRKREKRFKAAEQAIADEKRLSNTFQSVAAWKDGVSAVSRRTINEAWDPEIATSGDVLSAANLALHNNQQGGQQYRLTSNNDGSTIIAPTGPNYALNWRDPVNTDGDCLGDCVGLWVVLFQLKAGGWQAWAGGRSGRHAQYQESGEIC